ncbi:MAG: tripartite tricarboxylate transporter TctB family protein [Candidatus Methylomirabilales bacterium]
MKATEVGFAGFILAIGIAYEGMALGMPRGKLGYPGPGFFPLMVGAFLSLAAAGCLVQALLGRGMAPRAAAAGAAGEAPRRTHRAVLLLGLLTAYGLALKPVGFPLAIFLFVLAAMRIFGYRRWLPALAVTVVLAVFSYVTFVLWLKVPLPLGIVGAWLE